MRLLEFACMMSLASLQITVSKKERSLGGFLEINLFEIVTGVEV